MPTCIFILSRFTLRVDNVLFRARDTRIYHSFASAPPLVVRETRGWEASYERVKRVNYFCLSFVPARTWLLVFFFCPGSAPERRFDATDGPKLHLQGTLRHADGGGAGGGCRHWLARARKCRADRFVAVVAVMNPVIRPGTGRPVVSLLYSQSPPSRPCTSSYCSEPKMAHPYSILTSGIYLPAFELPSLSSKPARLICTSRGGSGRLIYKLTFGRQDRLAAESPSRSDHYYHRIVMYHSPKNANCLPHSRRLSGIQAYLAMSS